MSSAAAGRTMDWESDVMTARLWVLAALVAGIATAPAWGRMKAGDPAMAGGSGSTAAFQAAAHAMHGAMAIEYTGVTDVDFVRGMIPHHEGAIAMARIELEHGEDPAIRKLATAIIAAQEAEIADMKAWLTAHGG